MFLGIDIGTSGVKAILMDGAGEVVDQAVAAVPVSRPEPLWSEQDPADWWQATNAAVLQLSQDLRTGIEAIGLSGQMHGATLLDANAAPIRPAILWNDGRSAAACATLEKRVPDLRTIAGNLAMPGFTAPKLIWLAENEPDNFDKVAKVLLPKDYVRLLMTGDYASDMSDSAGSIWMDVGQRDWSDRILSACGLSRAQMPTLFEGSDVTGELRSEVAEEWGLKPNTPIVGGGGDNAAGAVGVGVLGEGDAFLSLGTSGVLFVADRAFRPNADRGVHTFCHAVPGLWHQMAVTLSAASCVDWAVKLTGTQSAEALIAAAETVGELQPKSPLFLPYLSGERTPHNDPTAKGVIFGLTHDSGPAAIGQAVLEGVALAFADGLSVLPTRQSIESITVIGGGSRSRYWGRVLAAALNRPLTYRKYADVGPALGAARLAQMGATGKRASDFAPPAVEHVIEPNREDVDVMAEKLPRFRQLYAHTQDLL